MQLDHGFCIPLWRMELERLPAIVPMIVNTRAADAELDAACLGWLIAQAIECYAEPRRVAILATGGLSHSIGEATMGAIDEAFDHEFIRLFNSDDKSHRLSRRHSPRRQRRARDAQLAGRARRGRRPRLRLIDYVPVPRSMSDGRVCFLEGQLRIGFLACLW